MYAITPVDSNSINKPKNSINAGISDCDTNGKTDSQIKVINNE
jgi:hypothetical protein